MAVNTTNGIVKQMISAKEAAALLGVSERRVRALCEQNRIAGAKKVGGTWVLPSAPKVSIAGRERSGKIEFVKDN